MKGRISVFGFFVILAALGTIGACLPDAGHIEAGTGGSGMISCGGASGTSGLGTWANVRDVVDNTCFGSDCHIQGDREPYLLGLTASALSDAALYDKLTTYKAPLCMNRPLVKPCAPDDSAFVLAQAHLCEGPYGTPPGPLPQMPFGCRPEYDNCTPADKLEGIRQWIANGAPRP